VDLHTCAAEAGKCSSFKCTGGYVLLPNAHEIDCQDEDCNNTDTNHCCALEGMCNTYKCPHSYVHKDKAEERHCANTTCTSADEEHCCQMAGNCGEFTHCSEEFVLRPLAPFIYCDTKLECSGEKDMHECCAPVGKCSSMKCPDNYFHKHEADSKDCLDSACSDFNYLHCCSEDKMCDTYQCPDGFSHVDMAEATHCADASGGKCSDADKYTCCQKQASCDLFACGTGFEWKNGHDKLKCAGKECVTDLEVSTVDRDNCCRSNTVAASEEAPEELANTNTTTEPPIDVAGEQDVNGEEGLEALGNRAGLSILVLWLVCLGLLAK